MFVPSFFPNSAYIKPVPLYKTPIAPFMQPHPLEMRKASFKADQPYQADAWDQDMKTELDKKTTRDLFGIKRIIRIPGKASFYLYDIHMQYNETDTGGNVRYLPSYLGIAIKKGQKEYFIYNPEDGLIPFKTLSLKDLKNLSKIMPADLIPPEDFVKAIAVKQTSMTDKLTKNTDKDESAPRIHYSMRANRHRFLLDVYSRLTGKSLDEILRENQVDEATSKSLNYEAVYQNLKARADLKAYQFGGPLAARVVDYALEHPPIVPVVFILACPLILAPWDVLKRIHSDILRPLKIELGLNKNNLFYKALKGLIGRFKAAIRAFKG